MCRGRALSRGGKGEAHPESEGVWLMRWFSGGVGSMEVSYLNGQVSDRVAHRIKHRTVDVCTVEEWLLC